MLRSRDHLFALVSVVLAASLESSCIWPGTDNHVALEEIRTGHMSVYADESGAHVYAEGRWKLTGGTKAQTDDREGPIPKVNVAEIRCNRAIHQCEETLAALHADEAEFAGGYGRAPVFDAV